jgi:uncharacterized membrane protein
LIPLLVLLAVTLILRLIGAAGFALLASWTICLRGGLFAMFLLTASAHWGKRRPDLIRMVPAAFPRPDLIVTVTGVLELLGAAGLLIPATSAPAAVCLAIMLAAMFPANVRATRHNLTIGGRQATKLPLRALLQLVFIAALIAAGFPGYLALR